MLLDLYFDDVTATYTPSNVIQYNEYYAHGSPTANSWTRESNTGNNFLANSGTELNKVTALYDLDYRHFDPILGRMNGVDPMADKYSSLTPYNYSFNSPTMYTDASGADPDFEPNYWLEEGMQRRAANKGPINDLGGGNPLLYNLGNSQSDLRSIGGWSARGSITKGSGGSWADGTKYSDWSLWGGSATYRYGLANGFTDIGGLMYNLDNGTFLDTNGDLYESVTVDWNELPEDSQTTMFFRNGHYLGNIQAYYKPKPKPIPSRALTASIKESAGWVDLAQGDGPVITGAVINTGMLSGDNNCVNCGFLAKGLGKNAKPRDGYFNGIEIQFNVLGNLKGYKVSVTRTMVGGYTYSNVDGPKRFSGPDGPRADNTFVSESNIYSIDSPGVWGADVNRPSGLLSFQMMGNFVETAIIRNQSGAIVSQYSVEWSTSMSIGRSSPDGVFQYLGGSIGPGYVKIP